MLQTQAALLSSVDAGHLAISHSATRTETTACHPRYMCCFNIVYVYVLGCCMKLDSERNKRTGSCPGLKPQHPTMASLQIGIAHRENLQVLI